MPKEKPRKHECKVCFNGKYILAVSWTNHISWLIRLLVNTLQVNVGAPFSFRKVMMNKCEICIIEKKLYIYIYTSLSCKELNQLYWFKSFHIYTLLPNLEASFSFAIYQIRFKTHNQQHAHHEVLYTSSSIGFLTGSQGGFSTKCRAALRFGFLNQRLSRLILPQPKELWIAWHRQRWLHPWVRGGSTDEALVLVDNIYIYIRIHLMVSEHTDCMPYAKTYRTKNIWIGKTTMISSIYPIHFKQKKPCLFGNLVKPLRKQFFPDDFTLGKKASTFLPVQI